jgi:hypothetical protein
MNRVEQEMELVRTAFPDAEERPEGGQHWVRIPGYRLPDGVFEGDGDAELAFRVPLQAGEAPYGFWLRPAPKLPSGTELQNYSYPAQTPWGADWGQFSWSPLDPWIPKTDLRAGANMLHFVRSFAVRLGEGS